MCSSTNYQSILKDIENKLNKYTQNIWNEGLPSSQKLRTYITFKSSTSLNHILNRNHQSVRDQPLPYSDVDRYRSVLRRDVSIIFVVNVNTCGFSPHI